VLLPPRQLHVDTYNRPRPQNTARATWRVPPNLGLKGVGTTHVEVGGRSGAIQVEVEGRWHIKRVLGEQSETMKRMRAGACGAHAASGGENEEFREQLGEVKEQSAGLRQTVEAQAGELQKAKMRYLCIPPQGLASFVWGVPIGMQPAGITKLLRHPSTYMQACRGPLRPFLNCGENLRTWDGLVCVSNGYAPVQVCGFQ
jgi:hypothetical protein